MKLFVDVDANGNIVDVLTGTSVVPTKEFHFEFEVDEHVTTELYKYQVKDGVLVVRAVLPEVIENIKMETQEQKFEKLKKDTEMNALAIMDLAELLMGGGA